MINPLPVKRNDRKYWRFTAKDSDGIINLSGATLVLTGINNETGAIKINRQACNITSAVDGEYEYRPVATDVDTVMDLSVEIEITPASGPKITQPEKADDEYIINIIADLDNS